MKRLIVYIVLMGTIGGAWAKTTLKIYDANGLSLFDGRNVMVGTELKLMVVSDSNDFWSGGLFINGSNRDLAKLAGSGKDLNSRDYAASHLEDAGPEALVTWWEDSVIEGFDLFSDSNCLPGDWFVVDYIALAPGDPNVRFYEYSVSWDEPNDFVMFHQVPTADFNTDGIVNFLDYALLASCWFEDDCAESSTCHQTDLDSDGIVDINDLWLFTDYWLWGGTEPNETDELVSDDPLPDPNLIYRIVDENGFNEITIDVGQTVTLYVDMETLDVNEVWAFEVEVDISDPNLGTIDNTAYDPNDPPGPGTARILADPNRWAAFDRWGPGYQQEEGIYLSGVSFGGAFEDGHLASFEFTCQGHGDIELSLINWSTTSVSGDKLYPTKKTILIHQNSMESQSMMSSEETASSTTMTSDSEAVLQEPSLSPDETVSLLEEIWLNDDGIQEVISEEDWQEFMESVEISY